jgi:hypothetical protein
LTIRSSLWTKRVISPPDANHWEQEGAALRAVGTEEAAGAAVQARQAALAIARRALNDTVVRAWHEGRIVGLTLLAGEMVVPSQALFTLEALKKIARDVVTECRKIRNQVDAIWNAFWSGGIANPLEVIDD